MTRYDRVQRDDLRCRCGKPAAWIAVTISERRTRYRNFPDEAVLSAEPTCEECRARHITRMEFSR